MRYSCRVLLENFRYPSCNRTRLVGDPSYHTSTSVIADEHQTSLVKNTSFRTVSVSSIRVLVITLLPSSSSGVSWYNLPHPSTMQPSDIPHPSLFCVGSDYRVPPNASTSLCPHSILFRGTLFSNPASILHCNRKWVVNALVITVKLNGHKAADIIKNDS